MHNTYVSEGDFLSYPSLQCHLGNNLGSSERKRLVRFRRHCLPCGRLPLANAARLDATDTLACLLGWLACLLACTPQTSGHSVMAGVEHFASLMNRFLPRHRMLFVLTVACMSLIVYDLVYGSVIRDSHVWIRQRLATTLSLDGNFSSNSSSKSFQLKIVNVTKPPNVFQLDTAKNLQFPSAALRPPASVLQGVAGAKSAVTIFLYNSPDMVCDAVRGSGWENQITFPLMHYLKSNPDVHLLDFGSFVGVYTLFAANMGRKVVAVDANRENLQRVAKSVLTNGFQDRVTLVHNALDASYGVRYVRLVPTNLGGSPIESSGSKKTAVDAIKADDILSVSSSSLY